MVTFEEFQGHGAWEKVGKYCYRETLVGIAPPHTCIHQMCEHDSLLILIPAQVHSSQLSPESHC